MNEFTCVYCLKRKPKSQFNREHVIPEAFGKFRSNLVLRNEVCRECNDYFGKTLDRVLARGSPSGVIRYLVGSRPLSDLSKADRSRIIARIIEDNQDAVDEVTFVSTEHGEGIRRTPGIWYWSRKTSKKRFVSLQILESDGTSFLDDLDKDQLIDVIWSGNEELNRLKASLQTLKLDFILETEPIAQEQPGERLPVAIDVIEDETTWRAVAKIAFNYLIKMQGAQFTLNSGFDSVREYIRFGTHSSHKFVQRIAKLPLAFGEKEAQQRGGHLLLLDYSGSKGSGIIGLVSLYYGASKISYEISFGDYEGMLLATIPSIHYFDVLDKKVKKMEAVGRPPNLALPF